jgi:hypothetical protein
MTPAVSREMTVKVRRCMGVLLWNFSRAREAPKSRPIPRTTVNLDSALAEIAMYA